MLPRRAASASTPSASGAAAAPAGAAPSRVIAAASSAAAATSTRARPAGPAARAAAGARAPRPRPAARRRRGREAALSVQSATCAPLTCAVATNSPDGDAETATASSANATRSTHAPDATSHRWSAPARRPRRATAGSRTTTGVAARPACVPSRRRTAAAARVGRPRVRTSTAPPSRPTARRSDARAKAVTAHAASTRRAPRARWSAKDHHLTASPPHDTHQAFAASRWTPTTPPRCFRCRPLPRAKARAPAAPAVRGSAPSSRSAISSPLRVTRWRAPPSHRAGHRDRRGAVRDAPRGLERRAVRPRLARPDVVLAHVAVLVADQREVPARAQVARRRRVPPGHLPRVVAPAPAPVRLRERQWSARRRSASDHTRATRSPRWHVTTLGKLPSLASPAATHADRRQAERLRVREPGRFARASAAPRWGSSPFSRSRTACRHRREAPVPGRGDEQLQRPVRVAGRARDRAAALGRAVPAHHREARRRARRAAGRAAARRPGRRPAPTASRPPRRT